jgi:hypothetical protein
MSLSFLGKRRSAFSSRSDGMFLASILAAVPMTLATGEMLLQANKMFPDGVVHDFGKVPSFTVSLKSVV